VLPSGSVKEQKDPSLMRGVGAGLPGLGWERRAVPDLARVDAAAGQFVTGRLDVGDDQPCTASEP